MKPKSMMNPETPHKEQCQATCNLIIKSMRILSDEGLTSFCRKLKIFLRGSKNFKKQRIKYNPSEVIVKKYDDVLNRNQRSISTGYDNSFPYLVQTDPHTDVHSIGGKE